MTTLVVAGLLIRQARGPGRVGFEGVGLISLYVAIVAVFSV
jgi:cation:H+ antiporter